MPARNSLVRCVLLCVGIAGCLGFALLLVVSWSSPTTIERWARAAIRHEVEVRVHSRIGELTDTRLVRLAEGFMARHGVERATTERLLARVPEVVGRVTEDMLDPACACRERMKAFLHDGLSTRIGWLATLDARLQAFVEAKYAEVSASLLREFRIFCLANALVFATLLGTALARRRAGLQLLLPAAVLIASACLVGYLYLFQQDWLQTILLGRYVGWWYFPTLGISTAFLADIGFNRARVTSSVLNALLSVVGSAVSVVPC